MKKTNLVRERVVNSHKVVPNYTYSLNTTVIKEHVYHDGTKTKLLFLTVCPGLGYVEGNVNVSMVMYMNNGKD